MNGRRVLDLDSDSIASSISRRNTENTKSAENDFVAWVERHSSLPTGSTAPVIGQSDDTDSVKSTFSYNFFNNNLEYYSAKIEIHKTSPFSHHED